MSKATKTKTQSPAYVPSPRDSAGKPTPAIPHTKLSPSFGHHKHVNTAWQIVMGPLPLSFVLATVAITFTLVWLTYGAPQWQTVAVNVNTSTANTNQAEVIATPSVITNNHLPTVQYNNASLTNQTGLLYGTIYPQNSTTTVANQTAVQPKFTSKLSVDQIIPVGQAYVYTVPQTIQQLQLELAGLQHFSTLPLNQFTYVNGNYALTGTAGSFQPLFVSLNGDGSVQLQMVQQAICTLPNLTNNVSNNTAKKVALDFLTAHHFIEVGDKSLQLENSSPADTTIPQDTFCHNGNQTAVHDRQFVVYAPQAILHFGNGADDLLPLRLPGIKVEVTADAVTQVKVDPLYTLQQYTVKGNAVNLISVTEAINALEKFTYLGGTITTNTNTAVPVVGPVFVQHAYITGQDRIQAFTVTKVKLEYVYDAANHLIEPYYVFTGTATNVAGKTLSDVRFYVVASTQNVANRLPYTE